MNTDVQPGTDPDREDAGGQAPGDYGGRVDKTGPRLARTVAGRPAASASALPATLAAIDSALIDALPAALAFVDADGRILTVNRRWREFGDVNGLSMPDHGTGADYFHLCVGAASADAPQARECADGLRAVIDGTQPSFSLIYPCHAPGEERWFQLDVNALDIAGTPGAVLMHTDISERERIARQLSRLTRFDALTGLPNRHVLRELLVDALATAATNGEKLAVLTIGVDRFNSYNDSLGHDAGDALLRAVADRLRHEMRPGDALGRLDGDEFGLIFKGTDSAGQTATLARKLVAAVAEPIGSGDDAVYLTVSVGISQFPDDARDLAGLVRGAGAAMHRAKALGRNGFQFSTEETNDAGVRRMRLEADLRLALTREEFVLHYQPKVDCRTGRINGVEALVRWRHPERGIVGPSEFIPVLEESGLIVALGAWTLDAACAQARAWQKAGCAEIPVAVNLSGRQLQSEGIVESVRQALIDSELKPGLLELELTESYLMGDPESAVATLGRLKKLGVRIAVDDFGTGYSSLAYLKRFPLDTLKVDRAFVKDISADPNDASITRAIITLAHSLKLAVVAEGVETAAQLGFLTANGCDGIQGYLFSRPVAPEAIAAMLREGKSLTAAITADKRTLLLVDDEENILGALKRLVRRANYRVLCATSGAEGLRLMSENTVDVVLSDQRMPGMTGVEFLRRVKDIHPHTVRMVLSGYTELQSVTDAINEGAIYKFLTKPWDDANLLSIIEEAFLRKELADQNRRLEEAAREAGDELGRLNVQLENNLVDQKRQTTQSQGALGATREALQHVPLPLLGIDDDGMIAVANVAAETLLSGGEPLLGRFIDECLPAVLIDWLPQGLSEPLPLDIGGAAYRVSQRTMSEASGASGTLIIIERDTVSA